MSNKNKYTIKQFTEAIQNTGGIRSEICNRLGCTLRTVYNYLKKYPALRQAIYEEEEKILDMAEGNLFSLIQNGDPNAIFYYLNNKGKTRGYGQPYKALPQYDSPVEESKTGVLVTPGLVTEATWEKAASNEKNSQM